jgi:hypothetical protein
MPSQELNIRGIKYPTSAKVVGYFLSAVPLFFLIFFGIKQAIDYKFNWV